MCLFGHGNGIVICTESAMYFIAGFIECTIVTSNKVYAIKKMITTQQYLFNPSYLSLARVATMNFSISVFPEVFALQCNALLWMLMSNVKLYTYNITTAQYTEVVIFTKSNWHCSRFIGTW